MKISRSLIVAVLFMCGAILAIAAPATKSPVKATVIRASRFDVSPPLRDIPPIPPSEEEEETSPPQPLPLSRPALSGKDALLRQPAVPLSPISSLNANFPGLGQGFPGFSSSYAPPDTNMAVGPNYIVQIVNAVFVVLSKSGSVILTPRAIQTLWTGFGGSCETTNDGDPIVQYDRLADRWVISQSSLGSPRFTPPLLECVAVSTGGDPTGSYNRYSFSYGSNFPDYPKMGIWPDAYYISYNLFNDPPNSFLGAEVCALDRTSMMAGAAATQQCFQTGASAGGLLPSDLDGSTPPPAGSPDYFASLSFFSSAVSIWKFHVDWTTPANTTFTGPTDVPVASYVTTCANSRTCVPQLGTSQQLDSLSDRLMYRLAYRNFGDHESLVVNHSVATNGSSGSGVRWYEIRISGGTPSLFQQGTYAPDSSYRWMGSIAMDSAGNMGLGFSLSDATLNPAIHYTGRCAGDPQGQMPFSEGTIINGTGSQLPTLSRWGDYSAMRIDPSDDSTFWYTTEYLAANGKFNWRTQIASFSFTPQFQVTAPASSIAGNAFSVTVTASGCPAYTGTVHLTSSDPQAVLPADSTLTNGVGTFSVILKTAGLQTVTATDTVNRSITGSAPVTVTDAGANHYSLTSPPTATAGANFTVRLVAQDQFNNTATSYTGTAHFTTSDAAGGVVVPADYPFVAGDNGQKIFNPGFTLQTLGAQTITAADKSNGSITATNPITVTSDAFITPQGRSIRIFRANIPVVVASFTDSDLAETGSNYTVSINWGDGSPPDNNCTLTNCKVVQVTSNPNVFNVIGAHTYKKKGVFTVQVALTDSGGSKADAFSTARFFPINSSH